MNIEPNVFSSQGPKALSNIQREKLTPIRVRIDLCTITVLIVPKRGSQFFDMEEEFHIGCLEEAARSQRKQSLM